MGNVWKYVGMIKDRVRVYLGANGEYCVNRDDDAKYVPTGEELEEIHLTYGSKEVKKGKIEKTEGKNHGEANEIFRRGIEKATIQAMIDKERKIEVLKETITALRTEAQEMEGEIEGIKGTIKEKDELNMALIRDLEEEKKQNLRWENFAHTAMKHQTELLEKLEAAGIGHEKEEVEEEEENPYILHGEELERVVQARKEGR